MTLKGKNTMKLDKVLRSGYVTRWHTNPDLPAQENSSHQWGVAVILMAEHPNPSLNLIKAALLHDVGEIAVGDLPAPFKKGNPEIAAAHKAAEDKARIDMCGHFNLNKTEIKWLKWADGMDAYNWMMKHNPSLADKDGWPEMKVGLDRMKEELGGPCINAGTTEFIGR